MTVLVAYASRHGATRGIAERIATRLSHDGVRAEAVEVGKVPDASAYDAVVIGSAAYMFHWLKDAARFVERNRVALAARPVWLFSSGPLGTSPVDAKGRDALVAAEPKDFAELRATLHPRGERVFFGALDLSGPPVGLAERFMRLMPVANEAMQVGDFRDWPAIDAWADEIAEQLGGRIDSSSDAMATNGSDE
jgi:menaquinone-dependent protoporphyrinogen oxidase